MMSEVGAVVAGSYIGVSRCSSANSEVEVVAVFDHDRCSHVLVQEWDRHNSEPGWVYRLWYKDGEIIIPVCYFEGSSWPQPPFVRAAQLVSEWREMHQASR
jgi:hypothetical protein